MSNFNAFKNTLKNTWKTAWQRATENRPILLLILAASFLLLCLFQSIEHASYSQLMLVSSVITGSAAACCFFRLQKKHQDKRQFFHALPHCILAVLVLASIQLGIQNLVAHRILSVQLLAFLFVLAMAFSTCLTGPIIIAENTSFLNGIYRSCQLLWRSPVQSFFTIIFPLSILWLGSLIAATCLQNGMKMIGLLLIGGVFFLVVPFMLACWVVLYEQLTAQNTSQQTTKQSD